MYDDDHLLRFLRVVVSHSFPAELEAFDVAAEKQLRRLRRGLPDSSQKVDHFEFLDGALTVIDCILLLKGTIEAIHWANRCWKQHRSAPDAISSDPNQQLSEVWARELRRAGLSAEKANDIVSRFTTALKVAAGLNAGLNAEV